ncbi:F-box protein-like protein [Tanacetum coccineum]
MSEKSRTTEDALPVEVIHRIQSLMPSKEVANTCMLSKSWLHAWYTIPTLRISRPDPDKLFYNWHNTTKYNRFIHTTLKRYHRENMPIESFHLHLYTTGIYLRVEDVKYWIQLAVSRNCLKELSIKIGVFRNDTLTLPNEIFSSQNLHIISVDGIHRGNMCLPVCTNPRVINCVSLRILDLSCVFITPDMFYNLLSTCTLLEKITLWYCKGLKKVKVKNLLHLSELEIVLKKKSDLWEINNVPRLCSFDYQAMQMKPIPFQIDSLASVTKLCIEGVIVDNSFFKTIESKFFVLESLTLEIDFWKNENMVITSVSLKWLTLKLFQSERVIDVQVNAPRLLSFNYYGNIEVIRKMMEGKTTDLKEVQLENRHNGNWEDLTTSWESVLHTHAYRVFSSSHVYYRKLLAPRGLLKLDTTCGFQKLSQRLDTTCCFRT